MQTLDYERRKDPGYEIAYKKEVLRAMRWKYRNDHKPDAWFPRSVKDSAVLYTQYGEDWESRISIFTDVDRFAMLYTWTQDGEEGKKTEAKLLYLDEDGTRDLLCDLDEDCILELYSRFGSCGLWNHYPWREFRDYLESQNIEYKIAKGQLNVRVRETSLDGLLEELKKPQPVTDEELLRRLRAIPNEATQKMIDGALKEGTPVSMLYDAIG